jgi:hypothetical protein
MWLFLALAGVVTVSNATTAAVDRFDANGVGLYLQRPGTGEPSCCCTVSTPARRIGSARHGEQLAADHQVITLDLPGTASRTNPIAPTRMAPRWSRTSCCCSIT